MVNYSIPYKGVLSLEELQEHLHSLPEKPDDIPYITSYYKPRWGFCLSENDRKKLISGNYEVVIDTELVDGSLTIGEINIPGDTEELILFSSYICHPNMANDELCAPLALTYLANELSKFKYRKYSYRVVLLPETIGSLVYLDRCGKQLKDKMIAGYTLSNIGQSKPFRYKSSRIGNTLSDRAIKIALKNTKSGCDKFSNFEPVGSDERQYCSPGFNLPVGSITRGEYAFNEYHCSADTLKLVSEENIQETVRMMLEICNIVESNERYINKYPYGEPNLGKHGLYPTIGATSEREDLLLAQLWVLNYSDGDHDLIAISETSQLPYNLIVDAANNCKKAGLIGVSGREF